MERVEMSGPSPIPGPPGIVNALLRQIADDTDSGALRTLDDYQSRFPGHEALVAQVLANASGDGGPRCSSSPRATTTDGSDDAFSAPPVQVLGNYRLLRQIGRGGQGVVWLAEDVRLGRRVALKTLRGARFADAAARQRFEREARFASSLDDPGICTVYEVGETDGEAWIAMRFLDGESLAGRLRRLPCPPDGVAIQARVRIVEGVARSLHAAHEAGIVHRDLKPGNVILTKDDSPVIVDFGLARGGTETLTAPSDVLGTPAYMAPERLDPEGPAEAGIASDVWSLGVILYEAICGRRPFEGPTSEALIGAITNREPVSPRARQGAVSKDLTIVILTALAKDPRHRYASAAAFAEDLSRILAHQPILARPAGAWTRLARWAQRNRALAAMTGGLFLVLTIGLVVSLLLLGARDKALREGETALTQVSTERNDKEAARSSLATSLTDYDRLGDLSRLEALQAEADTLSPCEPSKVAAMKAWVDQGADLERRLPDHRDTLGRLRASALPYTDEDRAADLAKHEADQADLATLRVQRVELAGKVAALSLAASRPSVDDLRARLSKLDGDIARLDAKIHKRVTYRFVTAAEQFKHDTTAKLVADLTTFVDPDRHIGLLSDIRARLAFAESVERETLGKYDSKWADAIRSIADKDECPKYGGLKIKPQLGLIPIGKDPRSGRWEFVHLQTVAPGTEPVPKRGEDGRIVVTEEMGIVFVLLPGGTFRMGAMKEPPDEDTPMNSPNVDPEALENEGPVTEVILEPIFLSKYEMTQGQWLRLVGKNPSRNSPGENFVVDLRNPVEQVSHEDCDVWLGRLGLVLPTEAQWEYGARGGTTTPRWTGVGTEGLDKAENLADQFCKANGGAAVWMYESWNDGFVVHAPVGTFIPNPFGLHDVLGNVRERCRDWYGGYNVKARSGDGLRSPSARRSRVFRGGTWSYDASNARSAARYGGTPELISYSIGVRPARPCDP